MKIVVAEVTAMNDNKEEVVKLLTMIRILNEDAVNNKTFETEDLELINEKTEQLQEQLSFWTSEGNRERFVYELKSHVEWFLKTFSDEDESLS